MGRRGKRGRVGKERNEDGKGERRRKEGKRIGREEIGVRGREG